jgi:hypothetical protein
VGHYVSSRCAVCGRMEALERHRRNEHFIETQGGLWIHLGECLAQWADADEAQRTDWSVQAVRWRDAS